MLARFFLCVPLILAAGLASVAAGTLTLRTNTIGPTPNLLSYNAGHFYPGSNTKEWWRYSKVTGARVFLTASIIEATDDIPGRGDGVTDQASFVARKNALRLNPLSPNYINWAYFTNQYNLIALHGANRLQPNYICTELRKLGVQIDVNIGASQNFFFITNSADWAGKWELWQHYYAQAFYLGRGFDVQRYQMFNEPDHSSAGGLTTVDYLQRIQLCADAIQSALADVNAMYGKSLVPTMLAPVITTSTYNGWGQNVITNRHLNYLGQTDPNFWLLRQYDYHQYNSSPTTFGANIASLRSALANAMSPETPFPVSISEFNVHTAANFDAIPDTLDYPTKYPRLGAIAVNLIQNGASEMYNFKFSQTDGDVGDNYPVRKNGMHYVDNDAAPYNIGGITKGGEVWRLLNKGFAPGRLRKDFTADSGLSGLALLASYDPATACYYIYSANDSTPDAPVTIDVSALNIPDNNRVLIEEVSEGYYGTVSHYTRVLGGQVTTFTQSSNTVWLITIPSRAEQFVSPGVPTLSIVATNDATVKDGANKSLNFGTQTNLIVRNDPANTTNRSAALLKFHLPTIYLPDVQLAMLTVQGATLTTNTVVQAHVYGITNNTWSQSTVTWATAPNLSQNVAAGNGISNQFVNGLGDSAFVQGQLVFSSTNFATQQIDVTDFIRTRTNYDASFLVSQDPRWNVTLPSLAAGDTQPDGMQLLSSKAASTNRPQLLLVRLVDTDGDGISDYAETNVFGTNPSDPDTDHDGVPDGYEILVAHTDPLNGAAVAPSISSQPASQSISNGGFVEFDVSANGTPPLAYQWRFNTTNILAGATNSSLQLLNVQFAQAGNYSVEITNGAGSVVSSNASLVVTSVPPPIDLSRPNVYEPFPYAVNSALVGQGGWLLNSGTSGTIEAGNLDIPGLAASFSNRLTWGSSSMSLRLPLGTNITTGELYFSFALRVDLIGSMNAEGTLAGFTTGTGTSFGSKINIRPSGAGFNLGTSKGAGSTNGGWSPVTYNAGDIIFVVGRYQFNTPTGTNNVCDLWLNPPASTFGAATPPASTIGPVGDGGADLPQIDRFFFRAASSTTSPAKETTDELRIGFTWASVTQPLLPPLSIQSTGGHTTVSWPTNAPSFILQQTDSLSPTAWSDVTNVVAQNGTNFSVSLPTTNAARFFRLRR